MKSMGTKFIFCVLIFLTSNLYSQLSQPVRLIYLPHGHSMQRLSGGGNLVASQSSPTMITSVNPAAISAINGFAAGISFQLNSSISKAWLADIGYKQSYPFYPQSFGLAYGWNDFTLGIGAHQIYNGTIDYGELTLTVIDDNQTGFKEITKIYPQRREIVITNSAVFSYNFKNLLPLPGNLSFGIRYHWNVLHSRFEIENTIDFSDLLLQLAEWEATISAANYAIGLCYSLETSALKVVEAGFFYESPIDFEQYVNLNSDSKRFFASIPAKLHAGGRMGLHNGLTVSANFSYYLWEFIHNTDELNQMEWVGNVSYAINRNLITTLGTLISDRQYDVDYDYFNMNQSLFVTYLTMGLLYQYQNYVFDFSLADSHLFSDDWRKQTILKLGIGYNIR